MNIARSLILFAWEWRELWRFCRAANRPWRRIVFYSEHAIYYRYFAGFLDVLRARQARVAYLTSDPKDPLLQRAPDGLQVFYFNALLPAVIVWLDARVLVLTMTDLHQFHIRRSIRGAQHLYVFHAMVSTHMVYRHGAFDHYDAMFLVGPHHLTELTHARSRYGRPAAQLIPVGYPWLERLYAHHLAGSQRSVAGAPLALIAPSWGQGNILDSCAESLVDALRLAGYRVMVRPHPEYAKRHPERLAQLEQRLAVTGRAVMERAWLSDQSLQDAELLVTDWSGIALEYALGTERPVLYIDTPRKVHNEHYDTVDATPLEVQARESLGVVVRPDEMARVGEAIARLTAERDAFRQRIRAYREQWVYHFGRAAEIGADAIEAIARGEPVMARALDADGAIEGSEPEDGKTSLTATAGSAAGRAVA